MTRLFKKSTWWMLLLLAFIPVNSLLAQNRQVTGTILSQETKLPVTGATVTVKGTNTAVTTDAQGKFSISVPSSATTLVITNVFQFFLSDRRY